MQIDRSSRNLTHAQLGTLQVSHHGHSPTFMRRHLPQSGDGLSMSGVVTMREINARYIHPSPDQAAYHIR
jgi:hypothetical protein